MEYLDEYVNSMSVVVKDSIRKPVLRPMGTSHTKNYYSRTSVARTPLGLEKLVQDKGSSSQ